MFWVSLCSLVVKPLLFLPNGAVVAMKFIALWVLLLSMVGCTSSPTYPVSDHYDGERFFNVPQEPRNANTMKLWWYFFTAERVSTVPAAPVPIQRLGWDQWAALSPSQVHVVRLGHSSLLLKLHSQQWLVDPVFSDRVSPVSFIGPKRFHPVPIDVDTMPEMDGLILSHDHYDHLDAPTLQRIHPKVKQFVTTLGVGARLRDLGVPAEKITELDWQQSHTVGNLTISAQPSQHFSGRSLFDRNKTLWASWVLHSQQGKDSRKIYFSADSGYFQGFKAIGKKHGPFDLTLIECGAWDANWSGIHMTPEEGVQAHIDLGGKVMATVHNSTFDLALHEWRAPLDRSLAAAESKGITLASPMIGEVMTLGAAVPQNRWWSGLQ
jgi:L-ascorbate metabolism protein UlaG (beta-lactamase superfamily)